MFGYKKKPGIYCEDCKHYIPSDSVNGMLFYSKCARLFETIKLDAPRVVRSVEGRMPEGRHRTDCKWDSAAREHAAFPQ